MNLTQPVAPAILAFATTLHLGLTVLRGHRTTTRGAMFFVSSISFLLAGAPWLMPSPIGLAAGFAGHLAWFLACERLMVTPLALAPTPFPPARPTQVRPAGIAHAARAQSRPGDFVNLPVMAVFDETHDIRTFRLARPDGFDFTAGQFLTVRMRTDGRDHVRCYSISSAPGARGHVEISVKRIGAVSSALHTVLRPGSLLAVRPPAGSFRYPADDQRPLVLIAGGVGITPLMSMLRHAVDAEPNRPVTLFYSVRRTADIAFRDELQLLSKRHQYVRVHIAVSEDAPGPGHFPGHISESLVTTMAPDVSHAICLICGPTPMMDAMTRMLTDIGVPKSQIRFEVFQAAVAASTAPPALSPTASSVTAGDAHDVTFSRSQQTARVDSTQTLLEAAEGCGADIPSLCRAGVCGTCRTRIITGDAHCSSSILAESDRAAGYVLACVTQVASDCTVDA